MHFDRKGEKNAYKTTTSTFDAKLTNFCCKHFNVNKQFMDCVILYIFFFAPLFSWQAHCINALVLCVCVLVYLRVASHFCGLPNRKQAHRCSRCARERDGECVEMYSMRFSSQCSGFNEMILVMSGI